MVRARAEYDIVIASDLRYPGGNSSSIVEEVAAQHAAGYRTALVHMPAGHMQRRRSFNHKILLCLAAGMATLETRPLRTRLLTVRQPRIFADPLARVPDVEADERILVINHPPADETADYYDVDQVRRRFEDAFGPFAWAPIGPNVRDAMTAAAPKTTLEPVDWHNLVDADAWHVQRRRAVGRVPVIGRHSRGHAVKWPDDKGDVLAAYPPTDDVRVEILGGAQAVKELLGYVPDAWTVHAFGAMGPRAFLRGVDVFVYFHHPGWVEAFGRNVIEALASGAPAVLPRTFASLLGDAAEYCEPAEVKERVLSLWADPARYQERSEQGSAFVDRRFGVSSHVERLARRIGPAPGTDRVAKTRAGRASSVSRRAHAMLVDIWGGPGPSPSLPRLLDVAAAVGDDIACACATTADGAELVENGVVLMLPLPSAAGVSELEDQWLASSLDDILASERPDVIVVDGAVSLPYWLERRLEGDGSPVVRIASDDAVETCATLKRAVDTVRVAA